MQTDTTPKFINRLIHESSPYLLQHAHNPVNWYAWGKEALELAKRENRPILLSIGYSTCHWCHVMERESFEDLEIAQFLNQHYVPIKVDREQRPDIDAIYMAAVQTMTGSGGWPMTIWLTPDQKPFYGGTYFPAREGDRGARIGFLSLLKRLHEIFKTAPQDVATQAQELVRAIQSQIAPHVSKSMPGVKALHNAFRWFESAYDDIHGGFGSAPKFPRPVSIEFLFHYGVRSGNKKALEMATHTLKMMARGGMYDQIGGGFHRYSVDQPWLTPHFEKMLYDNAQLVLCYLEAYQMTKDLEFAEISRETLEYVIREMTDSSEGFYSATDADSEGEEGKFFVWSKNEILKILGSQEGTLFCDYYGVTDFGNFEGHNILFVKESKEDFAKRKELGFMDFKHFISESKRKLYEVRKKRIPPATDDKVLTAWNGLMIAALAKGGFILNEQRYLVQASKTANFILTTLKKDQQLFRNYRKGQVQIEGYLDDYAFLIFGLLELFEATGELRWFQEAQILQDRLLSDFWDEENGGFFMTSPQHEELLAREKPYYDGAEPSGNSLAAWNLFRLEAFTHDSRYGVFAKKTLECFGQLLDLSGHAAPLMLNCLDYSLDQVKEILILEPQKDSNGNELIEKVRQMYIPNRVFVITKEEKQKEIQKMLPWVISRACVSGKATAYVCVNQTCELPTTDPKIFNDQLNRVNPLPE